MRLGLVGIFQSLDFNGLDLIAEGTAEMGREVPPYLKEVVDQGFYGPKTGRGFYDYAGRSEREVVRKRGPGLPRRTGRPGEGRRLLTAVGGCRTLGSALLPRPRPCPLPVRGAFPVSPAPSGLAPLPKGVFLSHLRYMVFDNR